MRAMILTGLLVFAWSSAASATDCPRWRSLGPAEKTSAIEGMISGHLGSHATKKYTSENLVVIRRCLKSFIGQIVEQVDQACTDRPRADAEFVDDIFDRYFLSCI